MAVKRSDLKDWAKEKLKGVENITLPSFDPNTLELDEEGIRWDVQQSIKHGFFSTLCSSEVALTFAEAKRFVEIVADEAKDKILVSTTLFFPSIQQNIEMAQHAAKVGCHNALLGYPPAFNPNSVEEIYNATKKVCEAADLGIVLYPTHNNNFEKFHPSGYPLDLLGRLVEIDNVIGAKIGSGDPGFVTECFERCADKALVNVTMVDWAPISVRKFGQQWIGASVYEIYQSPERPYLVNYFNLLLQGEYEKAMEVYWQMRPLAALLESHIFSIMQGAYPWATFKYYQWCVGANGGLARMPGKLFTHQMMMAKHAYMMAGIVPREPDEEFYVGRAKFGKK